MTARIFSSADQAAFARLSGDYNPIHLDDISARRLLFGAPVVHGVHALLWTLDVLCPPCDVNELELLEVKAIFAKPIVVGENVTIMQSAVRVARETEIAVKARLLVNEAVVATIWATYRPAARTSAGTPQPNTSFPDKMPSRELDDAQLNSMSGSVPLHLPAAAAELFPKLVDCLPATQLAVLLATTHVIGVQCPGLNSVFSELSLTSIENVASELEYSVASLDDRFGLATLDIVAPRMTGQLGAFRRPPARQQLDYAEFLKLVASHEFAGCRALLIGGSRGLGEVAAKILCAGGAEVRLTYHRGAEDARNIVADVTAHGGKVSASRFDISDPALPEELVSAQEWIPTHVLYFATPHIFSGTKGVFSPRLFNRFSDYFVSAFTRVFSQLQAMGTKSYFLPSSSAIDEMPPDMAEYVAAKVAAEYAARILEKSNKGIVIAQPRLPRLATDQTVTIAEVENGDPVPVLLTELRQFVGGPGVTI